VIFDKCQPQIFMQVTASWWAKGHDHRSVPNVGEFGVSFVCLPWIAFSFTDWLIFNHVWWTYK
jgi:hypothetical protein